MREIKASLTPEFKRHYDFDKTPLPKADPFPVKSYTDLIMRVAQLSILNKDYIMLFRGQTADYKNKGGASTFYPTIFRVAPDKKILSQDDIHRRFMVLEQSGRLLLEALEAHKIEGYEQIRDRELVRWSILQHYQVCGTPLFDLTQSLLVACSFATRANHTKHGYVYVFGLPHATGRITRNSEHDIILIRLLGIAPPSASKPLYQEGYLVGTEEITYLYRSKSELDFNRRLIAKFQIPLRPSFWDGGFAELSKSVLDPSDLIENICEGIKNELFTPWVTADLKEFFDLMVELERRISIMGSRGPKDKKSINTLLANLSKWGISSSQQKKIHKLFDFKSLMLFARVRFSPTVINEHIKDTRTIILALYNAVGS